MKHSTFKFEAPWSFAFGSSPSDSGYWMIWGKEKNGKTWFALLLAKYLSFKKRVLYISGEEGLEKEFVSACRRAGITEKSKNIGFSEYVPLSNLELLLSRRNAPKVVLIDNITVFKDELKGNVLLELKDKYPDVLFIFLAHEDRKEPYTAQAKLCRRLAKIIVHVEGLKAVVSGRCEGGEYQINEEKATLFYGQD
ncbi:ATP-binding protein [Pseudarcicella hirudinis]|nr:ATP-binding protein [Pseudarcicella hirudinis]